ncbi:olfactory receptor 14A16-like [Emydura macquarii macquarii]|uniref:olfactory receptor 14A16-like n=1 Tax=Emydura macquarii macquarii TaxID=1129001 RepID=UPI00352B9519
MGNLLIITAVALDPHLHSQMYFFLMNLSILDLGFISVTIPKSMVNSLMDTRSISYPGCLAQVFLLLFFASADFALLTVMAYDLYVAICLLLHYETVMNRRACVQMVAIAWICGVLYSALNIGNMFVLTFCGDNTVDQFFSEILQIFKTVLRIPSEQGRRKAVSTCLPHLLVISLFLCPGTFAYLKPTSSSASGLVLVASILYSVVPPMMNPIIYSIRNKEIKAACGK